MKYTTFSAKTIYQSLCFAAVLAVIGVGGGNGADRALAHVIAAPIVISGDADSVELVVEQVPLLSSTDGSHAAWLTIDDYL